MSLNVPQHQWQEWHRTYCDLLTMYVAFHPDKGHGETTELELLFWLKDHAEPPKTPPCRKRSAEL